MNKKTAYAIGLMSGTSLDGLDLVYVKFIHENRYDFQILAADTIDYSSDWRKQLKNAIHFNVESIEKLDYNYGICLGEQVNHFIQKHQIKQLDFIASHGHTVFHQPEKGITKQIGNGQAIADVTKHLVVCDFRTQDVKLGGQGAPLVPIGDRLLFAQYDACINLGGFANISYEVHGKRIAFDLCPVNVVLNHLSRQLNCTHDEDGMLSSKGKVNTKLLEQLNQLDFYKTSPPKSLGIEWVHQQIFPILESYDQEIHNLLRTFVEHSAIQIANNISNYEQVLFTGGGVFNPVLMQRIESLSSSKIIVPDPEIINFKEALIFAFLGWRKLENQVNCLSSVTGARLDHSSGEIFNPKAV
jgi:anhydro-N-acetylmuramic acid kinase